MSSSLEKKQVLQLCILGIWLYKFETLRLKETSYLTHILKGVWIVSYSLMKSTDLMPLVQLHTNNDDFLL